MKLDNRTADKNDLRKKAIGLCGAHRVGKTSLAEALGDALQFPFVKTTTSEVFKNRGIKPDAPMTMETRLSIQRQILQAAATLWSLETGRFVTDRTPLDMAAYTLADIQGTTKLELHELYEYLDDCFRTTNRFFASLIIVPPGIPLVHEQGKAALNESYIEHVHNLVVGLCHDERIKPDVFSLPRTTLSLNDRLNAAKAFLSS